MDKSNLIALAKDIYALTILFPKREPLRCKLREIADDMIAEFIMQKPDYLENLKRLAEIMDSYFEIAIAQDWVSAEKITEIKASLCRCCPSLQHVPLVPLGPAQKSGGNIGTGTLGSGTAQIARQNRIAQFLKEKGSAQVWEVQTIFPSVSKRTLRRDFSSMLEQGLIERTGERNTTAYRPSADVAALLGKSLRDKAPLEPKGLAATTGNIGSGTT